MTMQIKDLIPWNRRGSEVARQDEGVHPILGLQREMNRMFDTFWGRFDRPFGMLDPAFGGGMPRADVVETDKAVEVSVELPGMDEKDIDVSLSDDVLTIKGEKKAEREEKKEGCVLSERSFGSVYRTIPLPAGVDSAKAKAEFKKGVLNVTLPKRPEARAKAKKIKVGAG
jgi:HSP20 family protein